MREVANFTFNRSKRYRYQKLAKLVNYFYKMDQCESNQGHVFDQNNLINSVEAILNPSNQIGLPEIAGQLETARL